LKGDQFNNNYTNKNYSKNKNKINFSTVEKITRESSHDFNNKNMNKYPIKVKTECSENVIDKISNNYSSNLHNIK